MMQTLRKTTEAAIVILFSVLIAAVFFQVVARYVFNQPPAWSEELARYCQVWIIILASSLCVRRGSHLAVDYLGRSLPPRLQRRLQGVIYALMGLYAAVVTVFGVRLMLVGHYQVSPALQINMSWVYLIFPMGGALMILEASIKAWDYLTKTP
jgi:C4-dicarboxylate transporter DctQ subunit